MAATTSDPMRYFPYVPRPHQDRAVRLAANVFSRGGVGLLSADCGVGKTIAVLAGYLAARAEQPGSRLFILTRTHSQTSVFESEIAVLRSSYGHITATSLVSRAHMCPMREMMGETSLAGFLRTCALYIRSGRCSYFWDLYRRGPEGRVLRDDARELVDELLSGGVVTRAVVEAASEDNAVCPYELLRCAARESRIVIGPYPYLFKSTVRRATLASLGITLDDLDIIVDEAHNLPEHVLEAETARLSAHDLLWLRENLDDVCKMTGISWTGDVVDFFWESMMTALDRVADSSEIRLEKWDVAPRFVQPRDLDALAESARPDITDPDGAVNAETPLDRLIEFLYAALHTVQSEDWLVTLNIAPHGDDTPKFMSASLTVRPFNAAALAGPVLRGARAALLMSGTLRPVRHYSTLLGIPDAVAEELASPYPQGTRMVLVDTVLSTKYRERSDDLWRLVAERIGAVLSTVPAEKSALIAFPSYAVMREVLVYAPDTGFRTPLVESPRSQLAELADAIATGPHAIFCVYGGKFSEGVDLVESGSSMIDVIVGVGIPFSPPSSYQLALQRWLDERFGRGMGYYYATTIPSLRKVTQLIGRLRRSPSDWGIVVLIDRRFLRHLSLLGEDVYADLWPYSTVEELTYAIAEYLRLKGAGAI